MDECPETNKPYVHAIQNKVRGCISMCIYMEFAHFHCVSKDFLPFILPPAVFPSLSELGDSERSAANASFPLVAH
jgi:hypothetical protein